MGLSKDKRNMFILVMLILCSTINVLKAKVPVKLIQPSVRERSPIVG